jgi:hypothetical protein
VLVHSSPNLAHGRPTVRCYGPLIVSRRIDPASERNNRNVAAFVTCRPWSSKGGRVLHMLTRPRSSCGYASKV